ncbi:uncharacterized protein [Clinocottus analis]|uniref:uncharacterized protein n=1 Tax=Clinocottus analis TaxID=304258 RepID=UPI0035C244F7
MAGVYLRSLLEKLSNMDKCKRGFKMSESEVGTMLEHLQLVEIELQTLNVEKHLFENICLKMKENSLWFFGRRMQERQIELEKMKMKFQESQTETGFFRNIFRNIGATRDAAGPDAEDFSEKDGADVVAGVYLRSLLEKLREMDECKRGFKISENEVGTMSEHFQQVEMELQRLNVEKHLFEDICLNMKKKSLGIFGRRMQERQIELEKMKRKFQEPQTETSFLRNIFWNIGARDAADLDDLSEGEDSSSIFPASAIDQLVCKEGDSAKDAQAADFDDLDNFFDGVNSSSTFLTSITDQSVWTEWDSTDDGQAADADDLDNLSEGEDSSSIFPTSATDEWIHTECDSADDSQAADADDLDNLPEGEDSSSIFPTSATNKWIRTECDGADDAQAAEADDLDDLHEGEDSSSIFLTSATDQRVFTEGDGAKDAPAADADDLDDFSEGEDSSSIFPTSAIDQSVCTEWHSADDIRADSGDLDDFFESEDSFSSSATNQLICTEWDGAGDAQAADADDLDDLPDGEDSSRILATSATDPRRCTEEDGTDDVQALHGAYSGWFTFGFPDGQMSFFYDPAAGKDGKDTALPDDQVSHNKIRRNSNEKQMLTTELQAPLISW